MSGFDWAVDAFFKGAAFTAFDIETTGLYCQTDRIVELGAVKFDRRGIAARFSALVNPGIPMPAGASRVNGIDDAMLRDKAPIEEALPDFLRFTNGSILVAHNAPFDCGFINESLKRYYRGPDLAWGNFQADGEPESGKSRFSAPFRELPNQVADTLAFAREAFPKRTSYKLQDLAGEFGIDAKEAHRASDDARVCMEVFTACVKQIRPDFHQAVRRTE
ncbi:MAG: 3'-5' exonuclease [Spirochaetaceae bacterium]|jgi:DNA polymerase-3 subunit epsilon|nr:3'-5' exonuclease [Spirochaetaceae bacterium]